MKLRAFLVAVPVLVLSLAFGGGTADDPVPAQWYQPNYSGDTVCTVQEEDRCHVNCERIGPPFQPPGGGNWFLTTKCRRSHDPSNPTSPTSYALECECEWYIDYLWQYARANCPQSTLTPA